MQTKLEPLLREQCGTYAGAESHKYYKEKLCDRCKEARKDYNRKYSIKNKERIYTNHNNRIKERWATDAVFRETQSKWAKNNPEKRKEHSRNWAKRNRTTMREYNKWYRETFPHKGAERARRRRAKKSNNGYTVYTEQEVLELHGISCHICNLPIDLTAPRSTSKPGWEKGLHIDHLIPIAKGGPDTLENVRPAHGLCNISKGDKMPEDFEVEIDPSLFEDEDVELEDLDLEDFEDDEEEEED
jgi:hypothetical protein